jgi:D-tyrosyl-tRNA(Tyr) deacylase
MIAVIQRVVQGSVVVDQAVVGQIGAGMVALVAVHRDDSAEDVAWMANKLVGLRIFRNGEKHFDLDVRQMKGQILLVSNFTVAGETRHGRRPSLDRAADPAKGRQVFDELVTAVRALDVEVATGEFGAEMRVSLVNDGPVTFIVNSREETD